MKKRIFAGLVAFAVVGLCGCDVAETADTSAGDTTTTTTTSLTTEAEPEEIDETLSQANADKEEILGALRQIIQAYHDGTVTNNEAEPSLGELPDGAVLPVVESVQDFDIQLGGEMYAILVPLSAGAYSMNVYLSPMAPSAAEIAEGADGEAYSWMVNAVRFAESG